MENYFPIIYLKGGDVSIGRACETQEQAIEALKKAVERNIEKVKATTVIKRDTSKMKDPDFIFGHPKSLDVLQDKKFIQSI